MRAIVVGNAPVSRAWLKQALKRLKISKSDFLVGVDGGLSRLLEMGVRPKLAVGDWDSVLKRHRREAEEQGIPCLTLPVDKNRSDTYYGLLSALHVEGAVDELVCLGMTGGRPDHHLAALLDLSALVSIPETPRHSLVALGPEGEYHFLGVKLKKWKARLRPGQVVSVFSPLGKSSGVTLRGFRYGLKNDTLVPSSHGLSNEVSRRSCEVSLKKGVLIVMIPAAN